MKSIKYSIIIFCLLLLLSCATSLRHEESYIRISSFPFLTTRNVWVFQYPNKNIQEIYELIFNKLLIIGKSGFKGPYEKPEEIGEFAKLVGADAVILTIDSLNKVKVTEQNEDKSFYYHYDQYVYYLKNNNRIKQLWEMKKKDYLDNNVSEFDGIWVNKNYMLKIYTSDENVVGIIHHKLKSKPIWKAGDLKLLFPKEKGSGYYLMGDKAPAPAEFHITISNKLIIKLWGDEKNPVSFDKVE